MSAEAPLAVRSFKVGRYTCTLSVPRPVPGAVTHAVCEWHPHLPRRLMKSERAAYDAGRSKALIEISIEIAKRGFGL